MKIKAWFSGVARRWGETYHKRINSFVVLNAVGWVWASYFLAWKGYSQIAQQLSQTAVQAILGVEIAYSVKSALENVSKNGYVGKKSFTHPGKEKKE